MFWVFEEPVHPDILTYEERMSIETPVSSCHGGTRASSPSSSYNSWSLRSRALNQPHERHVR